MVIKAKQIKLKPRGRTIGRYLVEVVSPVLLLLAMVSTAFCMYQANLWSGEMSIQFSTASALRAESVRATNIAAANVQMDAALFTEWIKAKSTNNTILADFIEERFRDEFKPAFNAWLAGETTPNGVPQGTPFDLQEYNLASYAESQQLLKEAEEAFEEGIQANKTGDTYISTTVLFAMVLFFTGIESRWKNQKVRIAITLTATIVFAIAAWQMISLPRLLWII